MWILGLRVTNSVFLHSRKLPVAPVTDIFFTLRTIVLYLQSPLGSFWSVLKKTVWHFMASQKYSINVHLPTSGRAVVLPDRMAKRKPRGGLLQWRLNDIKTQKKKIDKWINHSIKVKTECNLAFGSRLSWRIAAFPSSTLLCIVSVYHNNKRSV